MKRWKALVAAGVLLISGAAAVVGTMQALAERKAQALALDATLADIAELGGAEPVLRLCGTGLVDPPTTVVEVVKERDVVPPRPNPSGRAAATRRESGRRAGGRGSERGRTRRG